MAEWETPRLTVDAVLVEDGRVLLIRRRNPPYEGFWGLVGGFVDCGESCEGAVVREMREETGLDVRVRELVGVYSRPDRDPRGHTVSIVYLVERAGGSLSAGDDAAEARFFPLDDLPELAFDHAQIIADAKRILGR